MSCSLVGLLLKVGMVCSRVLGLYCGRLVLGLGVMKKMAVVGPGCGRRVLGVAVMRVVG